MSLPHKSTSLIQKQGLTLVELLIAATIGTMILVITANLTVSIFRTRSQLQVLNEVQQSTNVIIQDMRDSIRWSPSVSTTGTTLTTTANEYTFSDEKIFKNLIQLNSPTTKISGLTFTHINPSTTNYLPLIRISFTINSTLDSDISLTPAVTFSQKRTKYGP